MYKMRNEDWELFEEVRKMVGANNIISAMFSFMDSINMEEFLEGLANDYELENIDYDNSNFGIAQEILEIINEDVMVDFYEIWESNHRLGELARDLITSWDLPIEIES